MKAGTSLSLRGRGGAENRVKRKPAHQKTLRHHQIFLVILRCKVLVSWFFWLFENAGKLARGIFWGLQGLQGGGMVHFWGLQGLQEVGMEHFWGLQGLQGVRMVHFWGLHELQVKKKGPFSLFHGVQTSCEGPFSSFHGLQTTCEGPFPLFARCANYLRGSFLIVSRAANSQQGSFSTLCMGCKPPARVLFHSLHGLQTSCEGAFFKGSGSYNSESRRKSDFLLFLPLQERVEILVLFFRMRMFYLRCL